MLGTQSTGFEPSTCWGVASGNTEMSVQRPSHGKLTWLGVTSPSTGKRTSLLGNFLTTE